MISDEYTRSFPRVIRIEPAGACNLSCSHCPTGTVKMKRGIMRSETFQLILASMQANIDAIEVVVLYHGGEPLLNKNFTDMVRQIKSLRRLLVKTVSNGMLMSEATMVEIVDSGLDIIEFSLDGQSSEQNNFVRRNCDYTAVVRNIKALIEYKQRQKSDTPKIFISTTQFLTKGMHHSKDQQPDFPEYLVKEFSGKYADAIADFKCTWAMRWPHMEVLDDIYDIYYDPYDTEISNYCDHAENTITIRWNGDVVACCYDLTSNYVLGNVRQNDLATIWNNIQYLGLRRSIDKLEFIPMCANCNVVKSNVYLTFRPEVLAGFGER